MKFIPTTVPSDTNFTSTKNASNGWNTTRSNATRFNDPRPTIIERMEETPIGAMNRNDLMNARMRGMSSKGTSKFSNYFILCAMSILMNAVIT